MYKRQLLNDPYRQPRTYEKPHLFSWVTNNYWTTNFRASQEGELNWSYTLTSCADTSNAAASAFGWSNRCLLYTSQVVRNRKTMKKYPKYCIFENLSLYLRCSYMYEQIYMIQT